jgi:mannosyltransferase OCH1-like enzyme
MIPRILHQTWKTADVPARWRPWRESWERHHAGWSRMFWTDEDNRALVATHYPWALAAYDAFPDHINRVDAIRFFLLHRYGGVYADLDFECLRPIDPLVERAEVLLGVEPDVHVRENPHLGEAGVTRIVCNAFMASTPGHPFWDHTLRLMLSGTVTGGVLGVAGGLLLARACDTYASPERLTIMPHGTLYPITRDEAWADTDDSIDPARFPGAYAVHHWTGSWWRNAMLRSVRDRLRTQRTGTPA